MRDNARSPPGEQKGVGLYVVLHTIHTPFTSEGGPLMMMRRTLAITAILFGLSTAAHADILAAGAIYGGPTQAVAACYLFNAGTGPVFVQTNQILREVQNQRAANVGLASDQCGATLAPNSICVIAANNILNAPHACKFALYPSAADVRGSFELRTSGNVVLKNVDLR